MKNNPARFKSRLQNFALAVLALALFFLAAETVFHFIPISCGIGHTPGNKIWIHTYWKPVNRFGFRDREIENPIPEKTVVFVLGASATAGNGIANVRDRFSDILQAKLGPGVRVLNMAYSGGGALLQIEMLKHFPYKPNILVFATSVVDISGRADLDGLKFKGSDPYGKLSPAWRWWVTHSHFLNYVFWLLPHDSDNTGYYDYMRSCYKNPSVMAHHLQDLSFFVQYAKKNEAKLVVVAIPFMANDESFSLMRPVVDFFSAQGIPTVNVADLIQGLSRGQRTVSSLDGHPSVRVHRLIAEEVYKKLLKI